MELWDIYDGCYIKTGRTHVRGNPLAKGDYHLVAHVYPVNPKGRILIQKRADTLSWKPGDWAATGGSAVVGEDAWTACRRELKEELGIDATRKNSYQALSYLRNDHITTVWVVNTDVKIEDLTLQKSEVAEVKWVTQEELKKMAADGVFLKYTYLDFLLSIISSR